MAELQVRFPSAKKRRRKRRFERPKFCRFCGERGVPIEYKDPKTLRTFLTEEGKILPRRISGNCAKHQRKMTVAVKRARHIALLPISSTHA